ncbi:PAS domain S-box-containing protein [Pedobacter sp. CAN_A7]|uniref:ATP-binding protein n=1 Tax=Pedobacter sp. CAN_A7 TaxID=2787722 RepID=UPI0018CAF00A
MDPRNDNLYKSLLEKTFSGIVFTVERSVFSIFVAGDEFLKLSGFTRNELLDKSFADMPSSLFHPTTFQFFEQVIATKQTAIIPPFFMLSPRNPSVLQLSGSINPVLNAAGEVDFLLYCASKTEVSMMHLIDQAPFGMGILRGKDLTVESANTMLIELWGKSEAVVGLPLAAALPELQGQHILKLLEDVYTWGEPLVGNEVQAVLMRNGNLENAYFNFVHQPIKDQNGVTNGVMIVAAEVTQLVQVKRKLEESVANFQNVVMNTHYGLLVVKGKSWTVEIANQPMLHLWGKTATEVMGIPLMKIFPEFIGQPFPEHIREVFETGQSFVQPEDVFYYQTADGISKKYVSYFYDPMLDAEGNVYGVIVGAEDITIRVENRLKTERAEEMLRIAIESANLGTWHFHTTSKRLVVSDRLKELFGYFHDEEMTYESFARQITEEYRPIVLHAFRESMAKGEQFSVEFSIVDRHDQKIRWMRVTGKIYRDQGGLPIRISGILMEITEHKQDEIRKNDFIAMVSHELKTPLTSLKVYVQLLNLKAKNSGDHFTVKSLGKVEGQVNKMNNMIRSFLDLSRLEAGKIYLEYEEFTIEKLIAEIVEEVSLTDKSHTILFSTCKPLSVYADREKIGQVINNLLGNAIKYSRPNTMVTIRCEQVGEMVQVSIEDEGIGIAKADQPKLFSRFYRIQNQELKTVSGFGIGLYLSAEIIQLHEGKIWIESDEGKGAVFYFTLPLLKK